MVTRSIYPGDRVKFNARGTVWFGKVLYIGPAENGPDVVGIELETKRLTSQHDGEEFGQRFFRCKTGYGCYVSAEQVELAPQQHENDYEEADENVRLRKSLECVIATSKPGVLWNDIAGLELAKRDLQMSVLQRTKFAHVFTGTVAPVRGILLYGPPGTGKTRLAQACATEAEATFFNVSSSNLLSKWMGESERLVRNLFEMARESGPSIIFIDELDSLCRSRSAQDESDSGARVRSELQVQMQGFASQVSDIMVLGATNAPWTLCSAMRRRFEKRIYIPLPEEGARFRMLRLHFADTAHAIPQGDLLKASGAPTDGFSCADVQVLARTAVEECMRRHLEARAFRQVSCADHDGAEHRSWTPCAFNDPGAVEKTVADIGDDELMPVVSASDFKAALVKCRPSVGPDELEEFEEFTSRFGNNGSPAASGGSQCRRSKREGVRSRSRSRNSRSQRSRDRQEERNAGTAKRRHLQQVRSDDHRDERYQRQRDERSTPISDREALVHLDAGMPDLQFGVFEQLMDSSQCMTYAAGARKKLEEALLIENIELILIFCVLVVLWLVPVLDSKVDEACRRITSVLGDSLSGALSGALILAVGGALILLA
eukprot:TRINITY_DN4582_c0_g1_i1.p1 TRINITY_DN4582_c0_g1~~TRINITY_DN4582_c0_g1_i1.p1  ORF type:complete len:634 (-),score=76.43 TRINITY_DN4582_c0_g1_i1:11-1816(-)